MTKDSKKPSALKLRIGLIIWLLSWFPFPSFIVNKLHESNKFTSHNATALLYAGLWTVQICVGLFGLWLVGSVAKDLIKSSGIKALPKKLWFVFYHGKIETPDNKESEKEKEQ